MIMDMEFFCCRVKFLYERIDMLMNFLLEKKYLLAK